MVLLLRYGADIGDNLLYAIQVECIRAVKILCQNLSLSGENEVRWGRYTTFQYDNLAQLYDFNEITDKE